MPLTKAGREQAAHLTARFAPVPLEAVYASDLHRAMETAAFAGQSRLARQRMVNAALGDIPGQRVHALAIKARAPGE